MSDQPRKPRAARATRKSAAGAPTPKRGRLAVVAAKLVTTRRENAEALVEAGRKSATGVKVVVQRYRAILRESLSELRAVAQLMRYLGARKSAAHLDKLATALVMLSISSVREIAALASTTQREALDILVSRLQDDLKAFQTMRSKKKRPS